MRKLISRILISAKIVLVKIWKKKDFPILIFPLSFFCQVFMQFFDLPKNAIAHIICGRCPKIDCSTKTSLWRPWDTKIKNDIPTISFIIFWDFSMFYQIFFSPQVKRSAIITYKHGIYGLHHELLNDLKLRILGN